MADKNIAEEQIKEYKKSIKDLDKINSNRKDIIQSLEKRIKMLNDNKRIYKEIDENRQLHIDFLESEVRTKDIWIYSLGGLSTILLIILLVK